MDMILVQVRDSNREIGRAEMPPLGIMYLQACLKRNHFECDIIDLNLFDNNLEDDFNLLRVKIKETKCRIIGFSSFTQNYYSFKYLCIRLKEEFEDIVVIYGGCHATFTIRDTMLETPTDIIIKQEGEETIVELLQHYIYNVGEKSCIKGIAYREGDRIIETDTRPLLKNLDALPFPDRSSVAIEKYKIPGTVLASRGCVGKCLFCAAEAMSGGKYRVRSAQNVCEEIAYLNERFGMNEISFLDNTFTVYKERTEKICEELSKRHIKWDCESRVDYVDMDLLKTMKLSGCTGIQYGIESGDDRVLKDIRKAITVEQIRKLVRETIECGISTVFCGFIIGHPTDTFESINNTVELAKEMIELGAKVGIKISTPFPGTQLEKEVRENEFNILTKKWSMYNLMQPIYETSEFTGKELYKFYIKKAEELADLQRKGEKTDGFIIN